MPARPAKLLLLALACAAPAFGAAELEAARARVSELRDRQASLRGELNRVADRVNALKASSGGSLVGRGPLEAELRRSQELSDFLTALAQEISQAQSEADKLAGRVADGLTSELQGAMGALEKTQDRAQRKALIDRLRALRDERDRLRASLSPGAEVRAPSAATSDDPADLLEQADAYRDAEDKLRQRVRALGGRIREVRDERELDRRMREFIEDESMFDEADRGFRSAGREHTADNFTGGPGPMTPGGVGAGPGTPTSSSSGASASAERGPADATGSALQGAARERDELEALEAESARSQAMADELSKKAADAERRARELR